MKNIAPEELKSVLSKVIPSVYPYWVMLSNGTFIVLETEIASKRKEVYQWARFYYENEPKAAAGIDFYAGFPMNGLSLECKDKKILAYYEHTIEKINLEYYKSPKFPFRGGGIFSFYENRKHIKICVN
jgi:hypothetical protein